VAATLFVSNDNDVVLANYTLAYSNAPVTDAIWTFTVYETNGVDVNGNNIQGPALSGLTLISMTYVSGYGYRGLIPGTAGLVNGTWYYVALVCSNYNDTFSAWFQAEKRTVGSG
jgi:hypothetical protein